MALVSRAVSPGGGGGGEVLLFAACLLVGCVQVLLELTRQADQEKPVLSLSVCQLGAEGRGRSFDLSVTLYLRRVALDYCDLPGGQPSQSSPHVPIHSSTQQSSSCASCSGGRKDCVHLISSSDQQGSDLLKVEFIKVTFPPAARANPLLQRKELYFWADNVIISGMMPLMFLLNLEPANRKQACEAGEQQEYELFVLCLQADPKGPSFQTLFCNTEQMLKVDQDFVPSRGLTPK